MSPGLPAAATWALPGPWQPSQPARSVSITGACRDAARPGCTAAWQSRQRALPTGFAAFAASPRVANPPPGIFTSGAWTPWQRRQFCCPSGAGLAAYRTAWVAWCSAGSWQAAQVAATPTASAWSGATMAPRFPPVATWSDAGPWQASHAASWRSARTRAWKEARKERSDASWHRSQVAAPTGTAPAFAASLAVQVDPEAGGTAGARSCAEWHSVQAGRFSR